jgi:hypothetical protein
MVKFDAIARQPAPAVAPVYVSGGCAKVEPSVTTTSEDAQAVEVPRCYTCALEYKGCDVGKCFGKGGEYILVHDHDCKCQEGVK